MAPESGSSGAGPAQKVAKSPRKIAFDEFIKPYSCIQSTILYTTGVTRAESCHVKNKSTNRNAFARNEMRLLAIHLA